MGKSFKTWFLEATLKDLQLEMAWMRFGQKWKDYDVNKVPSGMWTWLLDKMEASPSWTPRIEDDDGGFLNRNEIIKLAQLRIGGGRYGKDVTPAPQQIPKPQQQWVLATTKKQLGSVSPGSYVVMTQRPNKNWVMMTQSGETQDIPTAELKNSIESVRGKDGKPVVSYDSEQLFAMVTPKTAKKTAEKERKKTKKSGIIEKLSNEQERIDEKFGRILQSGQRQSHIVINADPGSGKTTMLNHLAWKYGKPGQKWLYLVFNTKNKVEATEKFPSFVEVKTTNSFLGNLLKTPVNLARIPQTERIVQAFGSGKKSDGGKRKERIEKIRFVVDSPQFEQKMLGYGVIAPNFNRLDYDKYHANSLSSIFKSILYDFKENVITLVELAKAYAISPRNSSQLVGNIKKVMEKHDNIDTELLEVKEKIEKYGFSFKRQIIELLNELLGYDFMSKDFTNEMIDACVWLLNETMPHGTQQKYFHQGREYELGQVRDFGDDAWFAVTHADELVWPKYDIVLADEVQDFNEARKIMLKKLHEAGARHIIAVGDSKQSLYRFIGADEEAMNNLSSMLGELSQDKDVVHTLTKNFRSRPAVLSLVELETGVKLNQGKKFEDDWEGAGTKYDVKYDDAFGQLGQEKEEGNLKETAMISRTNAPLVHAALSLLGKAIPFVIIGRDVAGDLMRHISVVIKRTNMRAENSADDLYDALTLYSEEEQDTHYGKSSKAVYLKELKETTEALASAIEQFQEANTAGKSISDFQKWLAVQLSGFDIDTNERDYKAYKNKLKKENPVILTTSHKAKGLEFDRVYILRYDQFPHPKAKMEADLKQEENSKFVALTRGRDEVHIVNLDEQPGYKK